ncbi:MAG: NRDE family protein [archaeon]
MCTFIIAWQVFADAPVVVAANRDEAYDRPAEPPSVRDGEPAVLAPRDVRAGGTWIGVNEHGVLAALTNRWVDAELTGERSRGLLVNDVLRERPAEDAGRRIERAVQSDEYQGFNLVVADATAALYYEWDGSLEFTQFDPGVHVVVNVGADGRYVVPSFRQSAGERQANSADRLLADLAPEPGETARAWHDRAAEAIADHEYGVCVHGDGFGTRSSSLIEAGREGISYRFAAGPPCETEYLDVSTEGRF